MADQTPKELLQPALLDRLSDDRPDQRSESRDERVVTIRRLRQCVVRDIEWLFNSIAFAASAAPGQPPLDPLVAASVLNYGIPSFAGQPTAGLSLPRLEQLLREAICNFEPRLLRESVRVRAHSIDHSGQRLVSFEVHAQLWAHPIPIELFLRTDLDLETGRAVVQGEQEGRG